MNYLVVYEKSSTSWSAYVPDLPGVITSGRTKQETEQLIREAIIFHIDGLREDNLPIPEPSASAEVVQISWPRRLRATFNPSLELPMRRRCRRRRRVGDRRAGP